MAWETKWQVPVAPDTRLDAQKIFDDQIMYGRSFSMDGKHIPIEDVLIHKPEHKTQQIKLGNKTIQVTVVGDLGLDFCEPEEKDGGWNIYHLPTLACFSSAVPGYTIDWDGKLILEAGDYDRSEYTDEEWKAEGFKYEYDKFELLRWMARVQENYPTSWQVLRLLTPDTYQDNGATAKEIIQKWCLSVKVE